MIKLSNSCCCGTGTIDKEEIRSLLHALGNHPTDKDILEAMVAMGAKEDKEQVRVPPLAPPPVVCANCLAAQKKKTGNRPTFGGWVVH